MREHPREMLASCRMTNVIKRKRLVQVEVHPPTGRKTTRGPRLPHERRSEDAEPNCTRKTVRLLDSTTRMSHVVEAPPSSACGTVLGRVPANEGPTSPRTKATFVSCASSRSKTSAVHLFVLRAARRLRATAVPRNGSFLDPNGKHQNQEDQERELRRQVSQHRRYERRRADQQRQEAPHLRHRPSNFRVCSCCASYSKCARNNVVDFHAVWMPRNSNRNPSGFDSDGTVT
mmetsp:Transcript_9704/g.58843  ORF Transcript_9704/g.58843 Transcript_9704/m.58843 type:complete len:231 (+) Transcript_9704:17-709(+)